MLAKIASLS